MKSKEKLNSLEINGKTAKGQVVQWTEMTRMTMPYLFSTWQWICHFLLPGNKVYHLVNGAWSSVIIWLHSRYGWHFLKPPERYRLLRWVQSLVPDHTVRNLNDDLKDGIILCALVDGISPGACSPYSRSQPGQERLNIELGLQLAEMHFGIVSDMTAEKLMNMDVTMETEIQDFLLKLYTASQLQPRKRLLMLKCSEWDEKDQAVVKPSCFAKGMGLMMGVKDRPACFSIYVECMDRLDLIVEIKGPNDEYCIERITTRSAFRNLSADGIPFSYQILDRMIEFSYIPPLSGHYKLSMIYRGRHIGGSPFTVSVDEDAKLTIASRKLIRMVCFRNYENILLEPNEPLPRDPRAWMSNEAITIYNKSILNRSTLGDVTHSAEVALPRAAQSLLETEEGTSTFTNADAIHNTNEMQNDITEKGSIKEKEKFEPDNVTGCVTEAEEVKREALGFETDLSSSHATDEGDFQPDDCDQIAEICNIEKQRVIWSLQSGSVVQTEVKPSIQSEDNQNGNIIVESFVERIPENDQQDVEHRGIQYQLENDRVESLPQLTTGQTDQPSTDDHSTAFDFKSVLKLFGGKSASRNNSKSKLRQSINNKCVLDNLSLHKIKLDNNQNVENALSKSFNGQPSSVINRGPLRKMVSSSTAPRVSEMLVSDWTNLWTAEGESLVKLRVQEWENTVQKTLSSNGVKSSPDNGHCQMIGH